MANKKKGKGILLNLTEDLRIKVYALAEKEKRTVTSIIEEAINIFVNNKLAKLNDDIFGKDDFDMNKETNIWG